MFMWPFGPLFSSWLTDYLGVSKHRGPNEDPSSNVPLLRAFWSLLDGMWGVLVCRGEGAGSGLLL